MLIHAPADLTGMLDLESHMDDVLAMAASFKHDRVPRLLDGKAVVVVFEKNSTRTRLSFDIGLQKLGATVSILESQTSQLGRGESIEDTAAVLSRYADAIVYRANDHQSLLEMAAHADVPVVNALTDLEHPCQVLADLMALKEAMGPLAGKTFCYVGDGNNMANSYLLGAVMAGMHVRIGTPPAFGPDSTIYAKARTMAAARGVSVTWTHDPQEAVKGAHAVATDTWVSMGDEGQAAARMEAFAGYTVSEDLMAKAAPGAKFLHCLPGHWGEEATHAVAHGPRSLIYDEAENRMWVQMAVVCVLLGVRPRAAGAA